jgi:hypothetical protein
LASVTVSDFGIGPTSFLPDVFSRFHGVARSSSSMNVHPGGVAAPLHEPAVVSAQSAADGVDGAAGGDRNV